MSAKTERQKLSDFYNESMAAVRKRVAASVATQRKEAPVILRGLKREHIIEVKGLRRDLKQQHDRKRKELAATIKYTQEAAKRDLADLRKAKKAALSRKK